MTGPELEFFMLRRTGALPNGPGRTESPMKLVEPLPHDQAGYFDLATDEASNVRKKMVEALEELGIVVEASHHEVAIGQHEIDFKYDDAMRTADNAVTFRTTLKAIAQQHGLYATFMPKPFHGINGSGMHTHQSLWSPDGKTNLFYDADDEYQLSPIARSFMAGLLAHAPGMIAILAPLVNSYKRLVPGFEAPVYISWARINRSALIRIPQAQRGRPEATRLELRCPGPELQPVPGVCGDAGGGAGRDRAQAGAGAAGRGEPVPLRRHDDPQAGRAHAAGLARRGAGRVRRRTT